ncbi:MAG: hypothetical protein IKF36_00100 [Bacilli bacterium]|nr:hypothetical protein [Bacilli bacterium]
MSRNLEEIAWDITEALYVDRPAIGDDKKANFFVAGSMATLSLLCADEIQDMFIDENGMFIGYGEKHILDKNCKMKLEKFRRKLHDVDVVSYDEVNYGNKIQAKTVPDKKELFDGNIDLPIEYEQSPKKGIQTYLCKAIRGDREIIVSSPVDMISNKLVQCMTVLKLMDLAKNNLLYRKTSKSEEELIEKNKKTYIKKEIDLKKKIRDLIILVNFATNIYSEEIIINRIHEFIKNANYSFILLDSLKEYIEDEKTSLIINKVKEKEISNVAL